jgi:hypothetical protein
MNATLLGFPGSNKWLLSLLFAGALAVTVISAMVFASRPRAALSVPQAQQDFGEVWEVDSFQWPISLVNQLSEAVAIREFQCLRRGVRVVPASIVVPPKGTVQITVIADLTNTCCEPNAVGSPRTFQCRIAAVRELGPPACEFVIGGRVRPVIITPERVRFDDAFGRPRVREKQVTVKVLKPNARLVFKNSSRVWALAKPPSFDRARQEYQLVLVAKDNLPQGWFEDVLEMRATDDSGQLLFTRRVPVDGRAAAQIRILPDLLLLGVVQFGHAVETTMAITGAEADQTFRVSRIDLPEGASVRPLDHNEDKVQWFRVRYLINRLGHVNDQLRIVVETTRGSLTLPLKIYAYGTELAHPATVVGGDASTPPTNRSGKDRATMQTLQDHWATRRKMAEVIKYEVSGALFFAKAGISMACEGAGLGDRFTALGDLPPADAIYPCAFTLLVDFARARVRLDQQDHYLRVPDDDPPRFQFNQYRRSTVCTGTAAKSVDPDYEWKAGTGRLNLYRSTFANDTELFLSPQLPLLLGHGYVPSPSMASLDALRHGNEGLRTFDEGTVEDANCIVLRSPPHAAAHASFTEYWVDPMKGGAVCCVKTGTKNQPSTSLRIEYEPTPNGWLPKSWVCDEYSGTSEARLIKSYRLSVTKRWLEPPCTNADFDIPFSRGMLVTDNRSSPEKFFHVSGDAGQLTSIHNPFAPQTNGSNAFGRFLLFNALLAGGLVLWRAAVRMSFRFVRLLPKRVHGPRYRLPPQAGN